MTHPRDDVPRDTDPADELEDRAIARALAGDPGDTDADTEGDGDGDAALAEYREVLAHLPFEEKEPPAALEDRVVAAALARRPAAATGLDRARRRRATVRRTTLAATAAAAAAIVGLVLLSDGDNGGVDGRITTIAVSTADVAEVADRAGSRTGDLAGPAGTGRVVLATDGRGFLYDLSLGTEPGSQLWLWLRTDAEAVAVGALASDAGAAVGFRLSGDVGAVRGVLLTSEAAGTEPDRPGVLSASGDL